MIFVYTIIDFEDGINLGWISEEYAFEIPKLNCQKRNRHQKYNELITKRRSISYLRALAIGSLINDAVAVLWKRKSYFSWRISICLDG